ncbi:MAG: TRAP transporter small permease [Eubacteriales bacterium]|jgi:TRAP-type C4-dicarboxylate transport system permease small subunit
MEKVKKFFANFELYICMVLLAVMVIDLIAQVFFRFVLNAPLSWSEELARWLYVWITCFGIGYGIQNHLHIEMEFFFNMFPKKFQKYFQIFINLVCTCSLLVILPAAIAMVQQQHSITSNTMPVPLSVEFIALPVGIVFAVIRAIIDCVKIYKTPVDEVAKEVA